MSAPTRPGDPFTQSKLAWFEQIATDPGLTHFDVRVGLTLGTKYLSRKTGDAYPSQTTLAADMGATPDGVRKSTKRLVGRGHLEVTPSAGRGVSSRYRLKLHPSKTQTQVGPIERKPQTPVCKTPDGGLKNPSPIPPRLPLSEPIEGTQDELFETWWAIYPRRVEKKAAKSLFLGIIRRGEVTFDDLCAGAARYCESDRVRRGYVKDPTTWLNKGCWADEPDAQSPTTVNGRQSELLRAKEFLK